MSAYLDHAATTPVRPDVLAAMAAVGASTGNPSSLHAAGRAARRVVDDAHDRLAAALGVGPSEVVLTAGGTEADNLAVKGLWWARRRLDPRRRVVLVSAVEHHAVLDPARWLATQGAQVVELPVDPTGAVRVDALAGELDRRADEVALVSVMWANNELGTLQPVGALAALAAAHGVPLHTDGVQAVGHVPVDLGVPELAGLAALSLSGHKLGAPVGVGALVVRRGVALEPLLHGGGQGAGVRSGTLDAAGATGLALAVEQAVEDQATEAVRLAGLRDLLWAGIRGAVPDAVLRGPDDPGLRLPGTLLVTFPGCDAEALLLGMDAAGVACSTGSACTAGVVQTSHVLLACGVPEPDARGALRFSLGWTSTPADVATALAALPQVVARARAAAAV